MIDFVKRVLVVALVVVALVGLWKVADALLLAVAGMLIAIFLHGATGMAERYGGLSRPWAWVVVLGTMALVISGVSVFLGSEIASQLGELPRLLPSSYDKVLSTLEVYKWSAPLAAALPGSLGELASQLELNQLGGAATAIVGAGVTLLLVFSVGAFLAVAPQTYRDGFVRLFPPRKRARMQEVLSATGDGLWRWLLGRLTSVAAMFVILSIGLSALGVPLALGIAVLGAVLDFVPFFGPLVAGGLAVLLALTVGPATAVYTGLLYLGAQQLEGNVLTPLIQQQAVEVPPALLLVNLIAFGTLFGVLGPFLATPVLVIALIWIKMLYLEDVLGEDADPSKED